MKKLIFFTLLVFLFACNKNQNDDVQALIVHSEDQLDYALQNINTQRTDKLVSPRSMEGDSLRLVPAEDWTSGFFPGNLWMMYELTDDKKWSNAALQYTLPLESEKWNCSDHDTGFKMYCSYGNAIKHDNNPEFKEILIQSAKTLSSRYNPVVGCIRSWNSNPKTAYWKFPVIIDNMMNLELLLWAAKETGNDSFREIAVRHAQTTLQHHFRNDYSCYHVVDYDPETGEVLNKNTHQGFSDESDWARGQAWAVYGFTMMYRETGMDEFLAQAKKVADYLLSVDGIKDGAMPYWDFKAPQYS